MTLRIERVVVTGGRRFTDAERIQNDLRALLAVGLNRVAEGACPLGGADDMAYDAWHLLKNESTQRYHIAADDAVKAPAKASGVQTDLALLGSASAKRGVRHPLPEPRGRRVPVLPILSPPLQRNIRMLEEEKPDLVLAYPDEQSRGTWHCVREACRRGITVALWAPGFEVWEFEGEDEHKPGIYVNNARGMVTRIDTSRSLERGRAPDGGGVSLDLYDDEPRFMISTFANLALAERLAEVLRG